MKKDYVDYALKNNYDKYSKFKSSDDFNNDFKLAMYYHKGKFTKSEYIALKKLSKYAYSESSPNTIGVAWSRGQGIVAATHKDAIFGISRSTFDRMLRKAKKLNLIKVVNQFRGDRTQKHNVYVFNTFNELTPEKFEIVSKSTTIDEPKTIDEPITIILELPKLKDINNTYQQEKPLKPQTDYQRVCAKIHGLFKEKGMTSRIFGVWLAQISKLRNKPSIKLALDSLHILVGEIKRRNALDLKPLNNPVGFFSGILKNLIKQWDDEQFELESIALFEYEDALRKGII